METQSESGITQTNPKLLIGAAIFLALAGVIILLAIVRPTTSITSLLPILATPTTTQNEAGSLSPATVTFTELNSDPLAYLNMPIQVSGSYLELDSPSCPRFTGPKPEWALVSEDLQLEAKGFERVVRILPSGTNMVVQGIWRLYQGPLGCGKGPSTGSAWYLQVQRIVQPNPLVGDGDASPINIEGVNPGLPALVATDVPTLTPTTMPTEAVGTPAATATLNQIVPSVTIAPTGTTDGSTAGTPSITPPSSNTPDASGNTPVPSSTPNGTATSSSGGGENGPTSTPQTPLPPTSTQTSGGGYPGPVTATSTTSPDPYP